MKYTVDVVLSDRFEVEADNRPDAVQEAVRRAIDMAACMCVEWKVIQETPDEP